MSGDSLAAEYVGHNLGWLQQFLRVMADRGIEVVIVEGHYHPAISNAETQHLSSGVRSSLETLAATTASGRYVPQRALHGFAAEDYRALTYVKPDAGDRFTRRLIDVLERPQVTAPVSSGVFSQSRISSTGRGL